MGKKLTKEEFIQRAQKVHTDKKGNPKYDYSKVEYVDIFTKVCIICPIHGEFWQVPNSHINNMKGCKKCAIEKNANKKRMKIENFISQAKEIHKNEDGTPKYDYSKVEYKNEKEKVCIICPIHGEFWQSPSKHIHRKQGCSECAKKNRWDNRGRLTTKDVIQKASEIHKDENGAPLYDYSKVEYKYMREKVCIICPIHGEFWMSMNKHIDRHQGCPECAKKRNVYETKLYNLLCSIYDAKDIIQSYKPKFLGRQHIDIYIKSKNIGIEYQGRQHFYPIDYFGGEKNFEKIKERDEIKYNKCEKNEVKLVYFTFDRRDIPINYPHRIYSNINDLTNFINKQGAS